MSTTTTWLLIAAALCVLVLLEHRHSLWEPSPSLASSVTPHDVPHDESHAATAAAVRQVREYLQSLVAPGARPVGSAELRASTATLLRLLHTLRDESESLHVGHHPLCMDIEHQVVSGQFYTDFLVRTMLCNSINDLPNSSQ